MKPRLIFCALLLLALAACKRDAAAMDVEPVAAVAADPVAQVPAVTAATAEIPVLAMQDVEGQPFDLAAHRGQWVVVNFWATWCAPCIKEMPELDAFAKEQAALGPAGWQVIGLAVAGPTPVREFLARTPVSFPVGLAGFGGTELARSLGNGGGGLPFTVVLDARGEVIHRKLGATDLKEMKDWRRQDASSPRS